MVQRSLEAAGNPNGATVSATLCQLATLPLQWTVVVSRGQESPAVSMYDAKGQPRSR